MRKTAKAEFYNFNQYEIALLGDATSRTITARETGTRKFRAALSLIHRKLASGTTNGFVVKNFQPLKRGRCLYFAVTGEMPMAGDEPVL